jgi:ADP-heptose:LPS heptosyltransferase
MCLRETRNLIGKDYALRTTHLAPTGVSLYDLKPNGKYFLIFPGSNGKYKMWPKERFTFLATELVSHTGYTAVVCGSHSEIELCESIAKHVVGAINLAGKTSILEAVELIRGATFVVGNDSSSIHIAAATNTTSFCILGGGHYGMFVPYPKDWTGKSPHVINYNMPCYGCGWRCKFSSSTDSPFPCIQNVSSDVVLKVILKEILQDS